MSSFGLFNFIFIFIQLQITNILCLTINRHYLLKPSTSSSAPDLNITTGPGATIIDDIWSIDVFSQQSADLNIQLGPSWGFSPNHLSQIAFIINGNTSADTYNTDGEILFVFSVADQYFAQVISLDYRKTAYKECPQHNLPLITRNVSQMISALTPDRYFRFCNNSVNVQIDENVKRDYWSNTADVYKQPAQWPMGFVIINDPINNTITYQWYDAASPVNSIKTTSYYLSSFAPNQGLNVYISGESPREDFFIFDIDITYVYTTTDSPSSAPTKTPTVSPTIAPTTNTPTTYSPTTYPPTTYNPTINPTTSDPTTSSPTSSNPSTLEPTTNTPTKSPITNSPTMANTDSPSTKSPATNSPTIRPPTVPPTFYPTFVPTANPTNYVSVPIMIPSTPSPILQITSTSPSGSVHSSTTTTVIPSFATLVPSADSKIGKPIDIDMVTEDDRLISGLDSRSAFIIVGALFLCLCAVCILFIVVVKRNRDKGTVTIKDYNSVNSNATLQQQKSNNELYRINSKQPEKQNNISLDDEMDAFKQEHIRYKTSESRLNDAFDLSSKQVDVKEVSASADFSKNISSAATGDVETMDDIDNSNTITAEENNTSADSFVIVNQGNNIKKSKISASSLAEIPEDLDGKETKETLSGIQPRGRGKTFNNNLRNAAKGNDILMDEVVNQMAAKEDTVEDIDIALNVTQDIDDQLLEVMDANGYGAGRKMALYSGSSSDNKKLKRYKSKDEKYEVPTIGIVNFNDLKAATGQDIENSDDLILEEMETAGFIEDDYNEFEYEDEYYQDESR